LAAGVDAKGGTMNRRTFFAACAAAIGGAGAVRQPKMSFEQTLSEKQLKQVRRAASVAYQPVDFTEITDDNGNLIGYSVREMRLVKMRNFILAC
jgi:hypothetical protein